MNIPRYAIPPLVLAAGLLLLLAMLAFVPVQPQTHVRVDALVRLLGRG